MQTKVKKWGNSLALRIPRTFAVEAGLESDSAVDLSLKEGEIVIRPIQRPCLALEELLAAITVENLHGETDTGPAVGDEVW